MLQIRRGKSDNLRITFHITPLKRVCDPSLDTSRQDGSNEGSQHMFLVTNKKIIFILSAIPPLIWSSTLGSMS